MNEWMMEYVSAHSKIMFLCDVPLKCVVSNFYMKPSSLRTYHTDCQTYHFFLFRKLETLSNHYNISTVNSSVFCP